jgi:SOS-response transcriptional repressor LexA
MLLERFRPKPLTRVEERYLGIIKSLIAKSGSFPTIREIAAAKGTPASIAPSRSALERLVRKNYLTIIGGDRPSTARGYRLSLLLPIPELAGGRALLAIDGLPKRSIPVGAYLIEKSGNPLGCWMPASCFEEAEK